MVQVRPGSTNADGRSWWHPNDAGFSGAENINFRAILASAGILKKDLGGQTEVFHGLKDSSHSPRWGDA
jgi:hypothetical protein